MAARFWETIPGGGVSCSLCAHECRIPRSGGKGKCGMRVNLRGTLVSLAENIMTSPQIDPIEKKPLFHFLPGTKTFSVGSVGCNFTCKFCQNYQISCLPSEQGTVSGKRVDADGLFFLAKKQALPVMAFTYNEPTISFELMYEVLGLLQPEEIRGVIVSNGFMSQDCLLALRRRVAAANIDLKSFQDKFYREVCGGRLQPVLDNLKTIKHRLGWWLEVTTLIIPGMNDSKEEIRDMARFIRDELDPETPWHLSAFHPAYQMSNHPATTDELLERCRAIASGEGLKYVYLGNVTGKGADTICPDCGMLCIERRPGYKTQHKWARKGVCSKCGRTLPGVWE